MAATKAASKPVEHVAPKADADPKPAKPSEARKQFLTPGNTFTWRDLLAAEAT
jgi:hypothetical protein